MNKENERTEYKLLGPKGKLPDSLIKDVVAFANSDGGEIYVGIADNGTIFGVDNPDDAMNRITNTIRDNIRPEMLMFISVMDIELDGKTVIKINVQPGTSKPYYVSGKGIRPEGVYIRKGSSTIPASEATIKEMLMQASGRSYESARSIEQDLTFNALKKEMSLHNLELGESQMKTLHLIGNDGLYTNLALLLSDQCPFTTKVAVFEENDPLIFQDRREMTGSILTQLDDVLAYIDQYNKTHAQVGAKYREDKKDYPPEAIREALLNCIVHRDYSFSGSNIINIYDDHMEFISIGSLLPGISIESVMRGLSQSRNKNLADIFYRMTLVESYGTGIKKIIKLFEGYKSPEFAAEEGGFFVTMYSKNKNEKKPQMTRQLQDADKMIMESVNKNGFVTRADVEEILNVKQTRAYMILKKLCDAGELQSVSEGKNTKYIKAN